MVFATREEEIDYLRDELERAGYDESSNQKWDEATLGRVRKLKLLEEEAPRRRRADVYDASGSDEEESDEEAEEVDEQGICWAGARGPDMEEEEAEAPTRRRCAHVKEDGRQCPNFVLGNNEKCDDFDPTRFCGAACAAAAAARAEALEARHAVGVDVVVREEVWWSCGPGSFRRDLAAVVHGDVGAARRLRLEQPRLAAVRRRARRVEHGGAGHAARAEGEQLVVVVGRARHGAVDDDVAAVRRPRLGRQQRCAAFQKAVAADVGEAAVAEDAQHGAA